MRLKAEGVETSCAGCLVVKATILMMDTQEGRERYYPPVCGARPKADYKERAAARREAVSGGEVEVVESAVPPGVATSGGRAGEPPAPRGLSIQL